jgi:hypothetical protein
VILKHTRMFCRASAGLPGLKRGCSKRIAKSD